MAWAKKPASWTTKRPGRSWSSSGASGSPRCKTSGYARQATPSRSITAATPRGLEAEPTRHLGPTASAIERRTGERSRKGQQHDQDALERLARAKALGELERQEKASAASILDLSGDIQAAKRDRAQQQEREAQAERQRIERMNSTELAQEIGRLRPPRWIAW
jgi:hypothetical protein